MILKYSKIRGLVSLLVFHLTDIANILLKSDRGREEKREREGIRIVEGKVE
jgi:hypothetical protein